MGRYLTSCIPLALVLLCSCAPKYVANHRNIPMFTKAGELQASVQIGNGIDVQSAFAVTKNFGVMANYAYASSRRADSLYAHTNYLIEGGVGFFENREKLVFEVFGGLGRGEVSTYDYFDVSPGRVYVTQRFKRFFIQPSIGFNKKQVNFGIVSRFVFVDFLDITYSGVTMSDRIGFITYFEPAFIVRIHVKNMPLYFNMNVGISFPVEGDLFIDPIYEYRGLQVGCGLALRLNGIEPIRPER